MKKMKLATKIASIMTVMLTAVFAILIGYTVLSTQKVINETVAAEFNGISRLNGLQVQQIIDAASTAGVDIESYMQKAYKESAELGENQPVTATSAIYDAPLTELSLEVEKYITTTASSVAINNPDIAGVGVMFEPYKFDPKIKDYAFYVSEKDAGKPIKPYGAYEEYSKETYYVAAKAAGKTVFTEPYDFNGVTMVSYAAPIYFNNELQCVVIADINVSNFAKIDTKNDRYKSMYATIYDKDGLIVFDSEDPVNIGKLMDQFFPNAEDLSKVKAGFAKGEAFNIETKREDGRFISRFYNPIKAGDSNWWTLTALDTSDKNEAVNTTTVWLLAMAAVALVIIIFTVITILRKMLNPIQGVVKAAESISEGNFNIDIKATSGDEIGILTTTFNNTAQTLRLVISDISSVLDSIANKNLNVKTSATYNGDLAQIEHSLANIIDSLNEVMGNINVSSDQVASGSDQVSAGAQALSQGATEQASSIEELSATIQDISEQIRKNAENAKTANEESTRSGAEVADSNDKMREMIVAIEQISNKSGEIGKIIKTIEDIAFQTNILALNAAVEAARAGEAGKGFAVVADEVRNLASKSAEAAKNTTSLIGETIKAVEEGNKIADSTAKAMLGVVESTKKVTDLINEIANASGEQATSITQVTLGVDQISAVVQTNSATSEESAASSEELSGQAAILKELVSAFKLKTNGGEVYTAHMEKQEFANEAEPVSEVVSPKKKFFSSADKY